VHVVFVEPWFPHTQREFVRALYSVGARVTAVGESPLEALDGQLQHWLYRYERVGSVTDEAAVAQAVARVHADDPVERLEATIEAHVLTAATVRERFGIAGTSVRTAWLCRDKPAMKEALRAAGIPCARSIGAGSVEELRAFAADVGYPLVVKPRDAAGAAGTWKVEDDADLLRVARESGLEQGQSVAVEEYNAGHEGFYDTLTVGGEPVHDFVCHYYPNVLEALRTRWISPQLVSTNRIDDWPFYAEVRDLGRRVVDALGLGTSATHMEWFHGPHGLRFSEIGCRPPGVATWDLYCAGNDFDLYREWALAVVSGRTESRPSRSHSAGLINLRPDRDGRISHVEGIEGVWNDFGRWVVDAHLPAPGTPTQPVEAGYMANAWIRLRHPDFDALRGILDAVGNRVQVRAE
jgi:formate-dependent phosphoribosylglycinamide formyltransferase (GAR transformylase)